MTERIPPADPSQSLWSSVDRLIDTAVRARDGGVDGLLTHQLGPLGARAFEEARRPVPVLLREAQRSASFASLPVSGGPVKMPQVGPPPKSVQPSMLCTTRPS